MPPIKFLDLTITAPATDDTGFLGGKVLRRQRAWLVEQHKIGVDASAGFRGFSDFTGWTTVTVTSADQLFAELAGSDATTRKRIYCQWNGVSNPTSTTANGPGTAALTPGGTEGTGYVHPVNGNQFRIEADTGYTPTVGVVGAGVTSMSLSGFGWLDFRNIGFSGGVSVVRSDGSFPLRTRAAFIGCQFGIDFRAGSPTATINYIHAIHVENCTFSGADVSIRLLASFARAWFNTFRLKNKNGDLSTHAPSTSTAYAGWVTNLWWHGNVVYECDNITTSANHCDLLQFGVGAELVGEMNFLFEFNLCDMNIPASQGVFTDGSGSETTIRRFLLHNNLIINRASQWMNLLDKSGAGFLSVHRNTAGVAATGKADEPNSQSIILANPPNGISTGRYEVSRNLVSGTLIDAGYAGKAINADNFLYNSGNWNSTFVGQVSAWSGDVTRYSRFDVGLTRTQAIQAYRDFFNTTGGYATATYGMRDPLTFPTDPTAVVT